MKASAEDRSLINGLFDDLARHGFTAVQLSEELLVPFSACERELRRARARLEHHDPHVAGCKPMIAFPDTSDAWGSVSEDHGFIGQSAYARPLPPWRFETLEERRVEAENAAWEAESAA